MIKCVVTSPKKTTAYESVRSLALPAASGQMQILPGHAESFVRLRKGKVSLRRSNGRDENIKIINGECHIKNDIATIIL